MAETTGIQWAHATFNPIRGCMKVSPGCKFCYAETLSGRNPSALGNWGPGPRVVAAESYWREPLRWNRKAAAAGQRRRVFCASLADVFEADDFVTELRRAAQGGGGEPGELMGPVLAYDSALHTLHAWVEAPDPACSTPEYRAQVRPLTLADVRRRLLELIMDTPSLDWLLVTKRPERILACLREVRELPAPANCDQARHQRLVDWIARWEAGYPPHNVWLGASVEDKLRLARVPLLLQVPAVVRFLSIEPLLESLLMGQTREKTGRVLKGIGDFLHSSPLVRGAACLDYGLSIPGHATRRLPGGIHWVIVGGESGGRFARPMHREWAVEIQQLCQQFGIPFFFKQWGSWKCVTRLVEHIYNQRENPDWFAWPAPLDKAGAPNWEHNVSLFVRDEARVDRKLNGVEYNQTPACRVCGCHQYAACEGGCHWAEPELCSRCAFPATAQPALSDEHAS